MTLPVSIPLTDISLPLLAILEPPLKSLEVLRTRIGMKGLSTGRVKYMYIYHRKECIATCTCLGFPSTGGSSGRMGL